MSYFCSEILAIYSYQQSARKMKGHTPSSVSISRQSPFLVEQGSWYNFYISVYSNHLPAHIALAAMLLVVGFIFSTPLSLFATIPMLYYITEVNSPENRTVTVQLENIEVNLSIEIWVPFMTTNLKKSLPCITYSYMNAYLIPNRHLV